MSNSAFKTENLIRVPFTGLSDFQPMALAPGLPMLDARKLTYQVLLGWFGDLLAEPELDDDGVTFHVQAGGKRQVITERSLVTEADLEGPLQAEFERLKKSLFDVRPVSPSERLIFNRLQPPIGNHAGFLYRVQTVEAGQKLVWCWGFQRRTQYGTPTLCSNAACSMLFLHDDLAEGVCPHCGEAFVDCEAVPHASNSHIPRSAIAAAAVLVTLAGGTFWLGSLLAEPEADPAAQIADTAVLNSDVVGHDGATDVDDMMPQPEEHRADPSVEPDGTEVTQLPDDDLPTPEPAETQPPELFVGITSLPNVDGTSADSSTNLLTEPIGGEPFPSVVSAPDLPDLPGELPESVSTTETDSLPADPALASLPELPEDSLPVIGTDPAETLKSEGNSDPLDLPDVLPEPVTAQIDELDTTKESNPESKETTVAESESSPGNQEPVSRPGPTASGVLIGELDPSENLSDTSADAGTDSPNGRDVTAIDSESGQEVVVNKPPVTEIGPLTWHSDYLSAYVEASQQKRFLLMLFENSVGDDVPASKDNPLFTSELQPLLEQFSRVKLSVNAAMPSQKSTGQPTLLLEHRSFRHLQKQAGLAVVDLTDSESQNFARVVSVLPAGDGTRFTKRELQTLFQLPAGSVSQRTLLFTIRTQVPETGLAMRRFSDTLSEMATRNSRYMAHLEQTGSFELEQRQEKVAKEFGPQAALRELVFATDSPTTIQDAALQAVAAWMTTSENFDTLNGSAAAMGMDLFQSPESGRWYATCLIVRPQ